MVLVVVQHVQGLGLRGLGFRISYLLSPGKVCIPNGPSVARTVSDSYSVLRSIGEGAQP